MRRTDEWQRGDPEVDTYTIDEVLGPVEDADDPEEVYEIPVSDEDAALIVNAPTDIAALIAEGERLRAELENARAQAQNAAQQLNKLTQGERGN